MNRERKRGKSLAATLRRMGYVRDQEGIMRRYLRERENWESHLKACRDFISGAFPDPGLRSLAILGSGWLLDVPLEALRKRFDKLVLADIRHPVQIRKRCEKMPGVELIQCDLSGGIVEQLQQLARSKERPTAVSLTESLVFSAPAGLPETDALVSLNLLNQLDILLAAYARNQILGGRELPLAFRQKIQAFHLDWLQQKAGCLITDVEERQKGREGKRKSLPLVHVPLPAGRRSAHWTWRFDQSGNYRRGTQVEMRVEAREWS
ncbi:MAG: hypothetical protein CSA96_06120 [Bacteroidetes bacterium]|nr:MAG: hypothetical protein CSA96_06120 [Bacteroidota bacterium]